MRLFLAFVALLSPALAAPAAMEPVPAVLIGNPLPPGVKSYAQLYGPNENLNMTVEKRGLIFPRVSTPSPQADITGLNVFGIDHFNNIPFAQPPVGPLRLKPPQKLNKPLGRVSALGVSKSCPQLYFSNSAKNLLPTDILGKILDNPLLQAVTNAGEDCLTLDIRRPSGTKPGDKLPVLFWIYGGGFEFGSVQLYNGGPLVRNAQREGKPFIFVAVNYRVSGFGFMPGKEILADGSSNLGLLDQRLALEWVADNIAAFGGDPDKVTIWGESAGSISVMDQMLLYNGDYKYKGKPLFRGALMNSGSIVPADKVDCPKGQKVYDTVVAKAGCSSAKDTLDCLRKLDYNTFLNAVNSVPAILGYQSVALSYLPRPDGKVLTQSPELSILGGQYAPVPFIVGDQEDEGTLFALFQSNITTNQQVEEYLTKYFFHNAKPDLIKQIVDSYKNISDGSPFRTGNANNWYPEFKRLAAILGDSAFTLTRRAFLELSSFSKSTVPSWSYLATYDHGLPIMGTFHASDILQTFYGFPLNYARSATRSHLFSFLYYLDPNKGVDSKKYPNWPEWKQDRQLMNFEFSKSSLLKDDFRQKNYELLRNNVFNLRL